MVAIDEATVPIVGEPVRVAWGLASVTGHVIETYPGVRPRVVVELDPGEVDDSAATVTVPLSALNPLDSAESAWARGARYEKSVADALLRLGARLETVEGNVTIDNEFDFLARLDDGRQVVVEVKAHSVGIGGLRKVLARTQHVARAIGASWLVVLPALSATEADKVGGLDHVVVWSDAQDDGSLRNAIEGL